MYSIVHVPNPILRKQLKPVIQFDDRLKKIIKEMINTLNKLDNPKGVGLAANQVGLDMQLFVFKEKNRTRPIINPQILWHSENEVYEIRKKNSMLEGCLSIPQYYGTVRRYDQIKIKYQTPAGAVVEETFIQPESVIVQHETDHLNGHLFIDRLLAQKGKLYKIEKHKDKEEMVEIEI